MGDRTQAQQGITSAEGNLLSMQLQYLRADVSDVKGEVKRIADNVQQLMILEGQQSSFREGLSRAFEEIKTERGKRETLDERVGGIEGELPKYAELRSVIFRLFFITLGAIALAVLTQFILDPLKRGWNNGPPPQKASIYRALY